LAEERGGDFIFWAMGLCTTKPEILILKKKKGGGTETPFEGKNSVAEERNQTDGRKDGRLWT